MFAAAGNCLVRTLVAPMCVACREPLVRPLDGLLCPSCWAAMPWLSPPWCARCGDLLASDLTTLCSRCAASPPAFTVARSAGRYEGPLRELIQALKYDRRRAVARLLANLMTQAGADLLADADAVVPVPLHHWRAIHRGFNQADDLAGRLGRPVWRVLARTRAGPPQSTLAADKRRQIAGAFVTGRPYALRPSLAAARRAISGQVLVLVDDVMTTGATLNACSQALLEAGAADVRALTAARAVAGRPLPQRPRPPRATASRR